MDSLRGKTPEQLKQIVDALDGHLKALHQEEDGSLRSLSEDEDKAFKAGMEIREKGMQMLEDHQRVALVFQKNPKAVEGIFNVIKGEVSDRDLDVRRMTRYEIHEAAMKKLESRPARRLRADQLEQVNDRMDAEPNIAARILLTENEAYRTGWQKAVTQPQPLYTDEERDALLRFKDFERAGA